LRPPKGDKSARQAPAAFPRKARNSGEPGWADGLRQLYDSVLNEPLPNSFDDLLKKLDKGDDA
jgi:Anti-sigma factor NepR